MTSSFMTHVRLERGASGVGAHVGFTCRTTTDESPEAARLTRLAVELAKAGDDAAFRYLYVRYSGNIYGYVRSILHDDHEAEDVTQHVFAKLITVITRYDDRGLPFRAWLLRLARNVAIDHVRSNRAMPQEEVTAPAESFGEGLENLLTIRQALATLPDDQRQVVVLRHVAGLSPGEIAVRMGRTEGSIHGLHHRGRRTLRQELDKLEVGPFTQAGTKHSLLAA